MKFGVITTMFLTKIEDNYKMPQNRVNIPFPVAACLEFLQSQPQNMLINKIQIVKIGQF